MDGNNKQAKVTTDEKLAQNQARFYANMAANFSEEDSEEDYEVLRDPQENVKMSVRRLRSKATIPARPIRHSSSGLSDGSPRSTTRTKSPLQFSYTAIQKSAYTKKVNVIKKKLGEKTEMQLAQLFRVTSDPHFLGIIRDAAHEKRMAELDAIEAQI